MTKFFKRYLQKILTAVTGDEADVMQTFAARYAVETSSAPFAVLYNLVPRPEISRLPLSTDGQLILEAAARYIEERSAEVNRRANSWGNFGYVGGEPIRLMVLKNTLGDVRFAEVKADGILALPDQWLTAAQLYQKHAIKYESNDTQPQGPRTGDACAPVTRVDF